MKISWPIIIVATGFLIRLLFLLFGAEIYYGKEDFYIGGDTNWWVVNIKNLIEHGIYTDSIGTEWGYFTRTPGYSFLIGFFYLIVGKNMDTALQLVPYFQLLTDTLSIYIIYKISEHIFKDSITPLIVSFLYAFYPFIIVWNVIVYAESLSVFLFFSSILMLLKAKTNKQYLLLGVVLSIAVLTRIQLILAIPLFGIIIVWKTYSLNRKIISTQVLLFCLSICLVYGAWPIRNYVNHDKLIFSQHLGDRQHWSPDYIKFMEYIWSVKVDYEPQYSQIISGDSEVVFPDASYKVPSDSILLKEVVNLARTCGEGFSYFAHSAGYRDDVVIRGEDCNTELVNLFDTLIIHQKTHNALSYYLMVPLGNLKKAIFKNQLYKSSSGLVSIIGTVLFTYRTLLILIGLLGLALLFIYKKEFFYTPGMMMVIGYVLMWYFFQSFYYRNMEIRYLLHADILLLIPAGYLLGKLFLRIKR